MLTYICIRIYVYMYVNMYGMYVFGLQSPTLFYSIYVFVQICVRFVWLMMLILESLCLPDSKKITRCDLIYILYIVFEYISK